MKIALTLLLGVLGLGSIASAESGVFCNPQNQVIEWICHQNPVGAGWVAQPDGCFHRNTYRPCNAGPVPQPGHPGNPNPGYPGNPGPGNPGAIDLRNTMFSVFRQPQIYFADQYNQYCMFRNQRDAERFRRNNYRGRATQLVREIPYFLRYVGICRVN